MLRQSVIINYELIDKEIQEEIFEDEKLWDEVVKKLLLEHEYKKFVMQDDSGDWVVFGKDA